MCVTAVGLASYWKDRNAALQMTSVIDEYSITVPMLTSRDFPNLSNISFGCSLIPLHQP